MPEQSTHNSSRKGFTLIEVLAAIFVLTVGLLSVIGVISTGIRWAEDVKIESLAAITARAVLDDPGLASGSGMVNGFKVTHTVVTASAPKVGGKNTNYPAYNLSQISGSNNTYREVKVSIYRGGEANADNLVFEIQRLQRF